MDDSEAHASVAIAGYRNSSPRSSMGFEFGVLELPDRRDYAYTYRVPYGYSYADSSGFDSIKTITGEGAYETAWTYVTFFIARARGTKGTVRSQFLLGPAAYGGWSASSSTLRDSTGAILSTSTGGHMESNLGLMTGFGATIGQGPLRPALRARGHWIFTGHEHFAATIEAGLDFN